MSGVEVDKNTIFFPAFKQKKKRQKLREIDNQFPTSLFWYLCPSDSGVILD